ncbi:hypothetical protein [Legionella erythra]|uniref:Phosphomannose isomerase GDP mannose pyrophosphorylase n=1 Tax=Legionella erythra TaxID=448 RepID=A0A0W0TUX3_LEGER|nr:hypothetical protein [Legionella erythra]KTC99208.1 phosphomannose isomerase GDP mannose pyrophosphorylase [Legionella erythra]
MLLQPLTETFSNLFYHKRKNKRARKSFILYKIVDFNSYDDQGYYKVQYINSKAVIDLTINDIVFDLDILHGLHPIQSCYIGIEYAKTIKSHPTEIRQLKQQNTFDAYSVSRYGSYNLLFQTRDGLIGFEHRPTQKQTIMDPQEVALSKELIKEFDAAQAFYIGLLAGLKMNTTPLNRISPKKVSHLRLVKHEGINEH